MLVLTRKRDEEILIGDDIIISVVSIDGDRVRIGIDAPEEFTILRAELLDETKATNRQAAHAPSLTIDVLSKFIDKK
ncbi:MAG TPA: carbon storage regulator CsrA [Clostridiales bacterium]|nr:carbon storage regulator CsrA [Clostridiales bacterium]